MTILAVDPGLSGAFCRYDPKIGRLELVAMPTLYREIGRKKNRRLFCDEPGIFALVTRFALDGAKHLFIEEVNGRPGQSASGAFTFGQGYGAIRMAAIANGLTIEAVPPARWKGVMRVPADKDATRERAKLLIPTHADLFSYKKNDGLAEAGLIALYAQRKIDGEPFTEAEQAKIAKARDARFDDNVRKKVARTAQSARMKMMRATQLSDDPELAKSLF